MKGLQFVLKTLFKLRRINKNYTLKKIKSIAKSFKYIFMSDIAEYTIEDKGSYSGPIGYIMEKNTQKKWVSQIPLDQIQITLKMKNPTYLTRLQLRGNQTEIIQIIFKDMDNEFIDSRKISIQSSSKDQTIVKNLDHSQMTAYVDLILKSSNGKPKQMGINFILFRGSNNPLQSTKQKITNLTSQHTIDKIKLDSLKLAPIRSKPVQPSKPYKNLAKPTNTMFNQRQKRNDQKQKRQKPSNKQEDQIQRAIKESQRTFNEQMKMKNLSKQKNKNAKFQHHNQKQDSDTMPLLPQREYQIQKYGKMINCMQHYNSGFLQALKKAQKLAGVREQQKLSNYITVKHLLNKEIYIDQESIKGQRKAKLQNIAEKLGAKIINSPKNYCIIISTSWDNLIVQNSVHKFSGVKAVNEDYLINCNKLNALLDWKDYSLKK